MPKLRSREWQHEWQCRNVKDSTALVYSGQVNVALSRRTLAPSCGKVGAAGATSLRSAVGAHVLSTGGPPYIGKPHGMSIDLGPATRIQALGYSEGRGRGDGRRLSIGVLDEDAPLGALVAVRETVRA